MTPDSAVTLTGSTGDTKKRANTHMESFGIAPRPRRTPPARRNSGGSTPRLSGNVRVVPALPCLTETVVADQNPDAYTASKNHFSLFRESASAKKFSLVPIHW